MTSGLSTTLYSKADFGSVDYIHTIYATSADGEYVYYSLLPVGDYPEIQILKTSTSEVVL